MYCVLGLYETGIPPPSEAFQESSLSVSAHLHQPSVHYRFVAVLIRLQGYFEELYSVFFKINLTNYGYYATTLPSYYISRISATDVEIEFS